MESAECSLDFGFGFNDIKFSDRTLILHLLPDSQQPDPVADDLGPNLKRPRVVDHSNGHEAALGNGNSSSSTDCSSTKMKTIHINTLILAARSPFFYKLFSNGMTESNQQHVTLQIKESEEAALMELLKFMYTNMLSSTTPSALIDVLMAADKYEVASCMKYCFQLLQKLPMNCELALLYLDLHSTILMADTAAPSLTDAAKEFLIAHFKDISKSQDEMLNLPLAGIEAVLSSNDLQVFSEDYIYDFVMKWARRHYTKASERREILITRLLHLIRFPFMSRNKLEEVLTCTDINLELRSKLVIDAISREAPDRQLPRVLQEQGRVYTYLPLRVIRFNLPHEECVAYLDLKREECARLLSSGLFCSQFFDLGGQWFNLVGLCSMDQRRSPRSFELALVMQKEGLVGFTVNFEVSARENPNREFVSKKKINCKLTGERIIHGLFGIPWDTLSAEDNPYFINGLLHLRVELRIKKESA